MRILATYFRDDAPVEVSLSAKCREGTLRWKASSAFIFGRAKEELIEKMTRVDDGKTMAVRKPYANDGKVGAKRFLAKAGRMGWGIWEGGAGDVFETGRANEQWQVLICCKGMGRICAKVRSSVEVGTHHLIRCFEQYKGRW